MTNQSDTPIPSDVSIDPACRPLCLLGGIAALIAVILFRNNFGAELLGYQGLGLADTPVQQPASVREWFTLLQENPLTGLMMLNLADIGHYALMGLLFLAIYVVLRKAHPGAMLLALSTAFIGIGVSFAANQAFAMLSLSQQYAAAATQDQQARLLAAGEALLAINNSGALYRGSGNYLSLFLVTASGLIISIVMLRSQFFGKVTASMGILAHSIIIVAFIALILSSSIVDYLPILSAPFRVLWYLLVAWRLFQLSSN